MTSSNPAVPIHVLNKRYGGAVYVFAVAMRDAETKGNFTATGLHGPASVTVLGENRTVQAHDGKWEDEFKGYGVHLYKMVQGTEGVEGKDSSAPARQQWQAFHDGHLSWQATDPLLGADPKAIDPQASIKDPTCVQYDGRWHLFATVRTHSGKVGMEYLNFNDWPEAGTAPRHLLNLHDQYHCAPQVFFFRPQKRWYLVYQLADKNRQPPFGPFYSTTDNLSDPASWSKPRPLIENTPEKPKWLDFCVICDTEKAHLWRDPPG